MGGLGLTGCQYNTLVLHILSYKTQQQHRLNRICGFTDSTERQLLPKLILIKGDRAALQLMGGYWKEAPTDAKAVRAVLTRPGWEA